MSKPIHIRELEINRMYGRAFRQHISDLVPGINIIWGPNGSGKTTIAHAIQTVLLKKYQFAAGANVAATLKIGDDELRFNIDGPRRFCTRAGQQIEWDSAPKLIRPDSYHFSLHDLLSAESSGREFAAAILREGSGGFDLRKAQHELDFRKKKIFAGNATKRFLQAQKELRTLEQQQKDLLRQKDHSHHIKDQLQQAKQAARNVDLFEKAQDWQAQQTAWREARDRLESFPETIRHRTDLSDVVSSASTLKERIAALREQQRAESARLAQLKQKITENPLYPNGLGENVLNTATSRVAQLRELDTQHRKLSDDLAGNRSQAINAWADLGMSSKGPEPLTRRDIDRLYDLIQRSLRMTGRHEALEELRSMLDFDPNVDYEDQLDRLRQQQEAVLAWIESRRAPLPQTVPILLMAALIGSALLAIALGLTLAPWAFAGLIIPVLIGLALALLRRKHSGADRFRGASDLASRLNRGEVGDVLTELLGNRSRLTLSREGLNRWKAKSRERGRLAADQQQLKEDAAALADEAGLDVADSTASDPYILRRLWAWRELTDQVNKLEGQRSHKIVEFNQELAKLNTTLVSYGESEAADVQQADAGVHQLRTRNENWKELAAEYLRLESESRRVTAELGQTMEEYAGIFARLELESGDMEGLRACVLRHKEYLKAQEALVKSKALLDQMRQSVEGAPDYDSAVLERDDLTEALAEARVQAARQEILQDELTTIRLKISDAESGRSLEGALARLEARRDNLLAACQADAAKAVGHVLAQRLDEHIRHLQLPRVFEQAQKIFLNITRGQYKLQFDLAGRFSALDTRANHYLSLEQLSSATRVQLLLSVRMAFVEKQELDYRLPVTLDETLGNSDDERASVVIKSMAELAQHRQVFYFTAQNDEVAKWVQHCKDAPLHIVPLTEDLRPPTVDPDTSPTVVHVPDAAGLTYREYGRELNISRWGGHSEVSGIHLWYLMNNTRQLQYLLKQGVISWGAAEALHASGLLDVPEVTIAQLRTLAEALKAWQQGWRVGRGRPVDVAVLKASGAVSDHFIGAVLDKCKDCNLDSETLLQALRNGKVKRFKKRKIIDLEQYLLANGYASPEDSLSDEEIHSRMMDAVSADLAECGLDANAVNDMLARVSSGPPVT
ncbi:MAG: AAA family ATPase [Bacteroidota bacterium]|nr:AAA family ATPase [Bacteroidota bacterium]